MQRLMFNTTYEDENNHDKTGKTNSLINKLIILLLMLFSFYFGYVNYPIKYILILGVLLLLLITLLIGQHISITFLIQDVFFFIYLIFGVLSLFYTTSMSRGIIFLSIWVFGLLMKIWLPLYKNNLEYINKNLYIFSGIHVFATLLQMLFPELIRALNTVILSTNELDINNRFLRQNVYAGITGQTGSNSFYISIFIGIAVCRLIILPKKQQFSRYILIFLSGLAILALVATQKRGPLLFCLVSILGVLYIWFAKTNKKIIRFIGLVTILCVIVVFIFMFTDYGQTLINRFLYGGYGGMSSGRIPMYILMWDGFMEKPILGNGLASTNTLLESLGQTIGHNVYFQSLYEIGLIGTLCLLYFMYKSLKQAIRMIKVQSKISGTHSLVYSLLISLYIQLYVIFYGLTGNPIYDHFQFIIYMIACAIPEIIRKNFKSQHEIVKAI